MSNPRTPSPPNAKSADLRAKQLSSLKERMRQKAAKDGRLASSANPSDSMHALGLSELAQDDVASTFSESERLSSERPFWEENTGSAPVAPWTPPQEPPPNASSGAEPASAAPLPGHEAHSHFDDWMFESDSREAPSNDAANSDKPAFSAPKGPSEPVRAESDGNSAANANHEPWKRPERAASTEPVTDLGPSPWPWEHGGTQLEAVNEPLAAESEDQETIGADEAALSLPQPDDAIDALGESFELSPPLQANAAAELDRRAALSAFRKEARERAESAHAGQEPPAENLSATDFIESGLGDADESALRPQATVPVGEELIPQRRLSLRERLGALDGPDEETPSSWDKEWANEEDFEAITREALAAMASGKAPAQEEPETDAISTVVSAPTPPASISAPEILAHENALGFVGAKENSTPLRPRDAALDAHETDRLDEKTSFPRLEEPLAAFEAEPFTSHEEPLAEAARGARRVEGEAADGAIRSQASRAFLDDVADSTAAGREFTLSNDENSDENIGINEPEKNSSVRPASRPASHASVLVDAPSQDISALPVATDSDTPPVDETSVSARSEITSEALGFARKNDLPRDPPNESSREPAADALATDAFSAPKSIDPDPQDAQDWATAVAATESDGFGDSEVSFTADDFDFDIPEPPEAALYSNPDSSATREFDPEAEMPIERSEPKGKPLPDGPVSLKDMIARARTVVEKSRDERPVNDAPRRTGFDALAERARKAVARRETAWGVALDPARIGRRGQEIVLSEFAAGGFQEGLIAVFEKGWDSDLASGELPRAASDNDQWELLDWLERLGARPVDAKSANRLRQWQRERNIKPEPSSLARTPGGMMFNRNNLSQPEALPPLFAETQSPAPATNTPSATPPVEDETVDVAGDEAATLSAMDSFGFDDLGLEGASETASEAEQATKNETQGERPPQEDSRATASGGAQNPLDEFDALGLGDLGFPGSDTGALPPYEQEPDGEASTLDAMDAFGLGDTGLSDEENPGSPSEPSENEHSAENDQAQPGHSADAGGERHDEATLFALDELGFDALDDAVEQGSVGREEHSFNVDAPPASDREHGVEPPVFEHEGQSDRLVDHDEPANVDSSSVANADSDLVVASPESESLIQDHEAVESFDFGDAFEDTPEIEPVSVAPTTPLGLEENLTPDTEFAPILASEPTPSARSSLRDAVATSPPPSAPAGKGTLEEQLAAARERNAVLQTRLLDALGLEDDFFAMEERAETAENELTRVREELFFAQAALNASEEKTQSDSDPAGGEAAIVDAESSNPGAVSTVPPDVVSDAKDAAPATVLASNALSDAERAQWERDQQRLKNLADLNELAEDDQRRALQAIQTARKAQKDAQSALAAEQERVLSLTAHDWLADTATAAQRQSLSGSALVQAAQAGNLAVLERAWLNSVADAEERDAALAFACEKGHLECAAWLLAETRANPNGLQGLPIFRAAKAQQIAALQLLRSWGGDWSKDGEHALRLVCAADNADGARVLIGAGCNPGAQNSRALREAIEAQAWAAAIVLIEAGASPLNDNGSMWPAAQERADLREAFQTARKAKENLARETFGFSVS